MKRETANVVSEAQTSSVSEWPRRIFAVWAVLVLRRRRVERCTVEHRRQFGDSLVKVSLLGVNPSMAALTMAAGRLVYLGLKPPPKSADHSGNADPIFRPSAGPRVFDGRDHKFELFCLAATNVRSLYLCRSVVAFCTKISVLSPGAVRFDGKGLR